VREGQFLCAVLRGWRFKALSRIAAKKFNEAENELVRVAIKAWRYSAADANVEFGECSDEVVASQVAATKYREQVLRLALLGWHKAEPQLHNTDVLDAVLSQTSTALTEQTYSASAISDSCATFAERAPSNDITSETYAALSDRTYSVLSDTASCADVASVDGDASGFCFLGAVPTWDLSRVINGLGKQRRVGVDLGGVIFLSRATRLVWKAVDGVRGLVRIFGAENVFIVSRVTLNGSMHHACRIALTRQGGFLEKSGIPAENVVFVPTVAGPNGKGAVSAKLGLTHFVDDLRKF
jgi:hypothetical protein